MEPFNNKNQKGTASQGGHAMKPHCMFVWEEKPRSLQSSTRHICRTSRGQVATKHAWSTHIFFLCPYNGVKLRLECCCVRCACLKPSVTGAAANQFPPRLPVRNSQQRRALCVSCPNPVLPSSCPDFLCVAGRNYDRTHLHLGAGY